MRIEDLDGPRIKPDAARQALDTLAWLGLDWDGPPLIQSHDLEPYRRAMHALVSRGLAFPSDLSRAEVEAAAGAPQEGSGEVRFPASMRPAQRPAIFDNPDANWRFTVDDATVEFDDHFAGHQQRRPCDTIGDFVIWTRRAQPAYQLAVVVDDHRQGVTDVVRGDDLLDSAARQLLLYRALGLVPEPEHWHLPLVLGPDGRRLAKRHGDTRVDAFRAAGVPPQRIIALLARWCGLPPCGALSARQFAETLDPTRIPRSPVVITPEDLRWLSPS